MAQNNAIDNRSSELTIDPGASGDSFIQFDINATGEFRIGVDDTDDSFRISQGSALGTNDAFIVSAAGEITKPLQPAFLAFINTTASNVTGDGTTYTVVWDTTIFDQTSDFDTGTGTFTAPITGKYYFNLATWMTGVLSTHTSSTTTITTSNRTYTSGNYNLNIRRIKNGTANQCDIRSSVLADMDAADTVTTTITVSNGTKVVDIASVSGRGYFSGNLLV